LLDAGKEMALRILLASEKQAQRKYSKCEIEVVQAASSQTCRSFFIGRETHIHTHMSLKKERNTYEPQIAKYPCFMANHVASRQR
jgi:hypothetical protein